MGVKIFEENNLEREKEESLGICGLEREGEEVGRIE